MRKGTCPRVELDLKELKAMVFLLLNGSILVWMKEISDSSFLNVMKDMNNLSKEKEKYLYLKLLNKRRRMLLFIRMDLVSGKYMNLWSCHLMMKEKLALKRSPNL